MLLHICLSSWTSLEIHTNEAGRAAEIKTQSVISKVGFDERCDGCVVQITFVPTWIRPKKKHVEDNGSQKDSPQCERAGAALQHFSVDELKRGL